MGIVNSLEEQSLRAKASLSFVINALKAAAKAGEEVLGEG